MKNEFSINAVKGAKWLSMVITMMFIVSCSNDESSLDEDTNKQTVITATELQYSDEAEQISEEITVIAEVIYAGDEISANSKSAFVSDFLPDCVTITTVVTDTTKEKTIDFGAGCELPNGNVLSGVIQMNYAKDMEQATKTISVMLENFTFNEVAVEGSSEIIRMRSNEAGNPQGTATTAYSVIWPDGETASYSGTRTREWIEGYGSSFWGDNVFLITGSASYTNKLGNTYAKTITEPLRREIACRFIVSGVLEISRNENTVDLDFGDGTCDAKGTLIFEDGTTEEIFLRRFLNN
ncbi:MAG: hypothetical protein HKP38_08580 [Croceitalea sp.]|nr:hypothetical protein [Croceitalea sp.]NNL09263.1 hypothetical protein [Croceitalea sp.]